MRIFSLLLVVSLFSVPCKKEENNIYRNTGKEIAQNNIEEIKMESYRISSGFLQTITYPSKNIGKRNIYIWTPDDYHNNTEKYTVLYMHDGQMLFDASVTWNKQEWGVDEVLSKLIKARSVKNTIVVGIWNNDDKRYSEYFPQKPFESLKNEEQEAVMKATQDKKPLFKEKIIADQYLKFIVEELKPYIDKNFRTLPDQQNTYIAGSSMGGLISMYAVCEYPQVFAGAACLSTHWIGTVNSKNNPIPKAFEEYIAQKLPDPKNHKFYFDYGSRGLDAYYGTHQYKINKILKAKGYTSKNWISRNFKGHDHSEKSWGKRLYIPLTFLLK